MSDECTDALQRLLSNSENTLTSIVSTLNAPLTIFADAIVDAATSADDFRLEDVRRRRMSIYVRIPPNRLANARPLLNLFFSQLISLNTQNLPEQDPTLKVQCLLVNDEFAAMGRVSVISSARLMSMGDVIGSSPRGVSRFSRDGVRGDSPEAMNPARVGSMPGTAAGSVTQRPHRA